MAAVTEVRGNSLDATETAGFVVAQPDNSKHAKIKKYNFMGFNRVVY